jgi:hypothetical protein
MSVSPFNPTFSLLQLQDNVSCSHLPSLVPFMSASVFSRRAFSFVIQLADKLRVWFGALFISVLVYVYFYLLLHMQKY